MASALKDGMVLGGNLPDSLSQYLHYGHDEGYSELEEDENDNEEIQVVLDAEKSTEKAGSNNTA